MNAKLQAFCSQLEPKLFQGITYLKELWRADLFDVPSIHREARDLFEHQVALVAAGPFDAPGAIMVVKGDGGSGKTHLLRAFRNSLHGNDQGFLAYLTLGTDLEDYFLYMLRQVVDSMAEPYWAPHNPNRSSFSKVTSELISLLPPPLVEQLQDDAHRPAALGTAVDLLLEEPRFRDVDSTLLYVLLHLIADSHVIHNRVVKYLRLEPGLPGEYERHLNGVTARSDSSEHARQMLVQLAKLIRALPERRMLTICVDQFEDFYDTNDATGAKFRVVCDTVRRLAEDMPGTLFVMSILGRYWDSLKQYVQSTTLQRFETAVELRSARTVDEARSLIAIRLAYLWYQAKMTDGIDWDDDHPDVAPFDDNQVNALSGVNARDVLQACDAARRASQATKALPLLEVSPTEPKDPKVVSVTPFSRRWNDYLTTFPTPEPETDDEAVANSLETALRRALEEHPHWSSAKVHRNLLEVAVDVPGTPGVVVAVCDQPPQFGHLQRQVDRLANASAGRVAVAFRTTPFPGNPKTEVKRRLDTFVGNGGRLVVGSSADLRAIAAMDRFRSLHRDHPEFAGWVRAYRPMSEVTSISQILEALPEPIPPNDSVGLAPPTSKQPTAAAEPAQPNSAQPNGSVARPPKAGAYAIPSVAGASVDEVPTEAISPATEPPASAAGGEGKPVEPNKNVPGPSVDPLTSNAAGAQTGQKPAGGRGPQLVVGRRRGLGAGNADVALGVPFLSRHAVFLGAPGSGKTTAALHVIESLALRGIPSILIDRKGDLASYAIADRYHGTSEVRQALLECLEVHLFTPGKLQGRPVTLPVLPAGVPEIGLDEAATFAASSIGALRGWRSTDEAKLACVKVSIEALARHQPDVPIVLPRLVEAMMDPDITGLVPDLARTMERVRQELSTNLILNQSLFKEDLEWLDPGKLLSPAERAGRTRLNVISTAFMDTGRSVFWLSQLLGMLHRHLQKIGKAKDGSLNGALLLDEADIYIPASNQKKPATKDPLYRGLMQWRAFDFGVLLATQSPGNLDGKVRDQVSSWFLGKIQNANSLKYLEPVLEGSPLQPSGVLPPQTTGEFVFTSDKTTDRIKAVPSIVRAQPVPLDTIEVLAAQGAIYPDES